MLLFLLIALDFGRIYLGYVNLQQMARIAANFAADNAGAWNPVTSNATTRAEFQERIENDARAINCELPRDGSGDLNVPGPAFPAGFDLGDPVEVRLSCSFAVITPVISGIVGNELQVGASAVFPVKDGVVATVPGGTGGGSVPAPTADFVGSPQNGYAPLEVTFFDTSTGAPTSWQWSFGNGSATTQGPHTRTYDCTGAPGTVCRFDVSLQVGNAGGFDTENRNDYIEVTVPPDTGPVADFVGNPRTGVESVTVDFDFVEITTGVSYTDWEWDFTSNGSFDATGPSTSHTYPAPGVYDVTLQVTDSTGATNMLTKTAYIVVTEKVCVVPDFAGVRRNNAQATWNAAGFTTVVSFAGGNGNYTIQTQSLLGGTIDPQPNGCASAITVGP